MISLKFSTIPLCFLNLTLLTLAQQQPEYLYHVCMQNATFFFQNSTYQTNLNRLLTSLSSNSTPTATNGFNTSSAGQNPNIVYGLFLCRGDVSISDCQNCVKVATEDILQLCPNGTAVVVWYDLCLLRYSNRRLSMAQEPAAWMWNTQNVTETARLNQLVETSMDDATTEAARGVDGGKKFAIKEVNFTGNQTVYNLVQCTPDLSSSDCSRCLRGAIDGLPSCCSGKQGGRVLLPSCNIRYEFYQFYNSTAVVSPPPPPAALPPSPPLPPPSSAGW